jgi:CRISPR-associated endoribonuclease Cas6
MRVRIVFSLKNRGASVPFHHQVLLTHFLQDQLRGTPFDQYPYFHFSGLKGQTRIGKAGLQFFSTRVTLVIASPSQKFIDYLLRRVFQQVTVTIGELHLAPEFVEKERDPELGEQVKYICISPIVAMDESYDTYTAKKFVSPEDDSFSDLLYENTMRRMEQTGGFSAEQIASFYKFQLLPDRNYLQKIQADEKKFARIYTVPQGHIQHEFRGYTLPFTLFAAPGVHQFVFECGLGAFANQGFGMIDLANIDPVQRTTLYELPVSVEQ